MKIAITGGSGFIGTNLINLLLTKEDVEIFNIDKVAPIKESHQKLWTDANIMDEKSLSKIMGLILPDTIIHLAAKTDTISKNLTDYTENTIGTQNLINAIRQIESVKHLIVTSTQYVYKSLKKPFPEKDDIYEPHTIYGQSKVIAEKYTRNANLKCAWTIIRPANIWGPWHMRYPNELWKMIDRRLYFHPGTREVIRTYGYVKNVAHQIFSITQAPLELVNYKTYYLGDLPIDSYMWLNELSKTLTGKNIKRAPVIFFRILSLGGDLLRKMGISFPIYTERFNNMIENFYAPTNITISQFGISHPDLKRNVEEVIEWVKGEGREYFEYWKGKKMATK
jgi:GlcNAc-P-P-Und epimerase